MRYVSFLAVLLALSAPARAQDFPGPNTGVYSWSTVAPETPLRLGAFAFAQDGTLFAGSTAGVDSSYVYVPGPSGTPSGRWRALGYANAGLGSLLPLGPRGDTLVGSGGQGSGRLFSIDGGVTMNYYEGYGSDRPGAILEMPPGHPHARRIASGGRASYSDDRGRTWTESSGPTVAGLYPSVYGLALLPSGRLLYASDGVVTSDDGGATYDLTPLYGPFQFQFDGAAAVATPGSVQTGAPACGLTDGALCEGAIVAGVEVPYDGVYAWRTNDGGRSWSERLSLPQPYDGIGYGDVAGVLDGGEGPDGLGRAVAVLGRGIIYVTVDGGQTWTLSGRMSMSLDGNESVHYAALGPDEHIWVLMLQAGPAPRRLLRSDQPITAGFIVASEGPAETGGARIEVYPNPGRDRTTVRVSPPEPSAGTAVTVHDALGRCVATLHNGPLGAGPRSFALDTSALSAGVYTVRSTSAGAVATARLVIAR